MGDKDCSKYRTLEHAISFPVPPLAEQKRIVNEVERWFTLIDALESNEGDLLKAIDQAKSKILDLAIHGKLVPQDPNDEPAIELLKRILEEKTQLFEMVGSKKSLEENQSPRMKSPLGFQSWEWVKAEIRSLLK